VYFKSKDNVSDCLTKALLRPLLEVGCRGLGMCDECDHKEYGLSSTWECRNACELVCC
jgi:hypothetical protein